MEGSGFLTFQDSLSSTWSNKNNNASHDQEVDLSLRLGLRKENQEDPFQGVIPQNFNNNVNIPTFHQQVGSVGKYSPSPDWQLKRIPDLDLTKPIQPIGTVYFACFPVGLGLRSDQGMGNGGILLQNAGGHERNIDFSKSFNHRPWPLPVLNMVSNNWSIMSGNSMQQQQQKICKKCEKTQTPLWRKGPDGPKTLCNGCGLRYAREIRRR
ncbi:hypothetical protein Vadar_020025 [Vaccinium darrowii]|uniref:Uncharacterized protein n=1 Tax=Vaccinium darrowii TaxID=229202 RepID=A0ACB7XB29_9ERIC|nr:hypothetical protein Vadar_020025 [Vaccinium darrowii]